MKVKLTPKFHRRTTAILRTDPDGTVWVIGYKRKPRSRKYHRGDLMLKEPRLLHHKQPAAAKASFAMTAAKEPGILNRIKSTLKGLIKKAA